MIGIFPDSFFARLVFYQEDDTNTLLDIEHIFILTSVWCNFLPVCITVQIKYINAIKCTKQG